MNSEEENIAAEIIRQNFDLEEIIFDEKLFVKIRELLISKIDFLLHHDFENLLQILYRIDVDEKKVKLTLSENSNRRPSEELADLVIERQIEKAKSRMKFKSDHSDF